MSAQHRMQARPDRRPSPNTLFIGEIKNIYSEEKSLENGKPDVKKVRPFLLTMPDNRFWSVGEQVGNAWKDGKRFKETMK